jgi:hypothetical protein
MTVAAPSPLVAPHWRGDDDEFNALLAALYLSCPKHGKEAQDDAPCACEAILQDAALLDRLVYVRRTNATYQRELEELRAALVVGSATPYGKSR